MNFLTLKTPFADFRRAVKGQLWGEFWHKQVVIHSAGRMRQVVPLAATAQKHGCAQ
jgi:hypothetical protein